jgi:hypothetical protein
VSRFFTIVGSVVILDLIYWFLADRALRRMPARRWWRIAWSAFMLIQVGCFAWFFAARFSDTLGLIDLPRPLRILIYLWHLLVVAPAVAALLALAVLSGVYWLVMRLIRGPKPAVDPPVQEPPAAPSPPPAMIQSLLSMRRPPTEPVTVRPPAPPRRPMNRREMLAATLAIAPPVAACIATGIAVQQLDEFRIRKLHVTIPGLPRALDGLRIAHVTDTHVGRFTRGPLLQRIVTATNELDAHLVLFTGDLIDGQVDVLDEAIDMVRALRGRYGRPVVIEGNHDLFQGRDYFENRLRQAKVNLLVNEATTLTVNGQRIQFLGLRWGSPRPASSPWEGRGDAAIRASMEVLRPMIRRDSLPILLAHHPHAFDVAVELGIPLTLSGHTHGGQIMLTRHTGAGNLVGFRYMSGVYQRGDSALVVSNGVGNWFPLRINAPAEIIDLTLHATSA